MSDHYHRLADGNLVCTVCGCLICPGFEEVHDDTHEPQAVGLTARSDPR